MTAKTCVLLVADDESLEDGLNRSKLEEEARDGGHVKEDLARARASMRADLGDSTRLTFNVDQTSSPGSDCLI